MEALDHVCADLVEQQIFFWLWTLKKSYDPLHSRLAPFYWRAYGAADFTRISRSILKNEEESSVSEIDAGTVAKIARLARIKLDDAQQEPLAQELTNILDWVEQLGEVNTDDIQPMASPVDAKLVWREDIVTDGNKRDDVLANAPRKEFGFFAVPKVIE